MPERLEQQRFDRPVRLAIGDLRDVLGRVRVDRANGAAIIDLEDLGRAHAALRELTTMLDSGQLVLDLSPAQELPFGDEEL